ncbi:unnamed protein product [Closterium sp. NIES-54]
MTLRPSSIPQCVVLPLPPSSSLPDVPDFLSNLTDAASPTVTHCLATLVTDPTFSFATPYTLVTKLVDFAATCHLGYLASLVSNYACPPSVLGKLTLGCHVLMDRQVEMECLADVVPHLAAILLAPEGESYAMGISTPRSYPEAVSDQSSSRWQTAMDAEMASWKTTCTFIDAVPPPRWNIVNGMWIFWVHLTTANFTFDRWVGRLVVHD